MSPSLNLLSRLAGILRRRKPAASEPPPLAADWERIAEVFTAALARAPEERSPFLATACSGDATLRREVDSLLAAHVRAGPVDLLADAMLDGSSEPKETIGTHVGHYQLQQLLGAGGMGVVYRAHDTRLDRAVALKFLPEHLSNDQTAKQRFLREAQAAASLDHPNICTIHEIGETADQRLFIAMPFYQGEGLDVRLARGPLSLPEALDIAAQTARGLQRAHERGIVHRDVKPANLMLTDEGVVKILDFGIAKIANLRMTMEGLVVGSLPYMSPEQASGGEVDHRSDLWSLGVVLHEMIEGKRLFRGEQAETIISQILRWNPASLRAMAPGAATTWRILARLLAKAPDRYPSAAALLPEIEQALEQTRGEGNSQRAVETAEALAAINPEGERRQVTVVVARLAGYSSLLERAAPGELQRAMASFRKMVDEVVGSHAGIVNRFGLDEFSCLFGVPVTHEDDCAQAIRAALELQRRLWPALQGSVPSSTFSAVSAGPKASGWPALQGSVPSSTPQLSLQIGVGSGLCVVQPARRGDCLYTLAGQPLEIASMLASHASPSEILVPLECRRLVVPFFAVSAGQPLHLPDRSQPMASLRIVGESGVATRLEGASRSGLTEFTGREQELAALVARLEQALQGRGQVVTVVGDAGLGKSRLLYEFTRGLEGQEARLIRGRCSSQRSSSAYFPFIEALQELLGLSAGPGAAADPEMIISQIASACEELRQFLPLYLHVLGVPSQRHPLPRDLQRDHLRSAIGQALSAIFTLGAAERGGVMLLEDWHWADDGSREALRQLADIIPSHRLLLVVTYRPGHGLVWNESTVHATIQLGPLDFLASMRMACSVMGVARLPEDVVGAIHERAGGNPFFLEELCQTLLDQSLIRVDGGGAEFVGSLAELHLPATVQGVIRTRLDRLDADAREVVRVASVVGREFALPVLQRALGGDIPLERALGRLKELGLVNQVRVLPEPTYRFKHVLTQEVAYDTLLQHQRRQLHRRVGAAIESLYAGRTDQHAELLAHHFGQAEDWRRAVRYGREAATKAHGLSEFARALEALQRVEECALKLRDETERHEVLVDALLQQERQCETLGLPGQQQEIFDRLVQLLEPERERARLAEVNRRQGDLLTRLKRYDEAETVLRRALQINRELRVAAGERDTLNSLGLLCWHSGRNREALGYLEQAMEIDRARGDRYALANDLHNLGAILKDLGEYERSVAVLEQALAEYKDSPVLSSHVLHTLGTLFRLQGKPERSLEYMERALARVRYRPDEPIVEDKMYVRRALAGARYQPGLEVKVGFTLLSVAHLHLEQGRVEESLDAYREAVEVGRRTRNADGLSQSLRILGEVLMGLGRSAEALPYFRDAVKIFAQLENHPAQAQLWAKIATIEAKLGNHTEAEAGWTQARQLFRRLRKVENEVDALMGVARSARIGRQDFTAARMALDDALRLVESLGDKRKMAEVCHAAGMVAWHCGAHADALRHYGRALELCKALGDSPGTGLALNSIGVTLVRLGQTAEAQQRLEEATAFNRKAGERLLEGYALAALGDLHYELGRLAEAKRCYLRSLRLRHIVQDRRGQGWMLERLARISRASADFSGEARQLEAARRIAEEIGEKELLRSCQVDSTGRKEEVDA